MRLLAVLGCFVPAASDADTYEFVDRLDDVLYLDLSEWKTLSGETPSRLPSAGDSVYLSSGKGRDIDVYLDGDVSEKYTLLVIRPFASSSLRFCGKDGFRFEMPSADDANYRSGAFYIQNPDGDPCLVIDGNGPTNAVFAWTDADFTASTDADLHVSLAFVRGDYDFCPDATAAASAEHTLSARTGADVSFAPATSLRTPKFSVSGGARVTVSGSAVFAGRTELSDGRLEFLGADEKRMLNGLSLSGAGTLAVDGDAVLRVTAGNVTVNSESCPRLVVSNGVFDATKRNMFIGSYQDGAVSVYGGTFLLTGPDGIQIGNSGGNGRLELHDGVMKVSRVRVARGTASATHASVFVQKGGVFTATDANNGIHFQQSCTGNNLGTHTAFLDGGVCTLGRVFRDSTVTAGTAVLSADGGTLRPLVSRSAFIAGLTRAEFGAKGLTLDTDCCDVGITVPCVDKTDADGLFVKKGAGTLSFSGREWSVSRTVVEDGIFKFSADKETSGAFVVRSGGALSLAGTATSLTIGALTVTNGVLELDPGDVIAVDGPLALSGLRIRWTSVPEAPTAFLSVKGTLSDALRHALRRVYSESLPASGGHCGFAVVYDEETKTTHVTCSTVPDAALSGETRWTGSGAWSSAANWEGGVKPTAASVAVFDGASAGTSVAVAAGDVAGALRFAGADYTLAGEDPLLLEGDPGAAKVEVSSGSQTLAVPLDLASETELAVASGAELTLDGGVVNGALVKTGRGRLVLSSPLATHAGLTSRDGTVVVTDAAAFGTSRYDETRLRAGTLEIDAADGAPITVASPVKLDGLSGKTTVVFNVKTDVTLKDFNGETGYILTRGGGTLTIDVPAGEKRILYPGDVIGDTESTPIAFPADGSEPTGHCSPVRIADGELRVTGGAGAVLENLGSVRIGVPLAAPGSGKPAVLTVDGIEFNCQFGASFYPGYNAKSSSYNTTAILRILNGGKVFVKFIQPGYACTQSGTRCVFALTNGFFRSVADGGGYVSRGRLDATLSTETLVQYRLNASRVEFTNMAYMDGSVKLDADNGSYFGGCDGSPLLLKWNYAQRIYGEMLFRNGSTLALREITEVKGQTRPLTFAFDDAEWRYDAEGGDKTWPAPAYGFIRYEMRGRGVVLRPAAGKTFRTDAPFTGTGGVVNAGKGTVAFGPGACAFSGVLEVADADGAVDLSAAGSVTNLSLAGPGAVVGGTLAGVRFARTFADDWTTADAVPVLRDCAVSGAVAVDAGRTAEDPLPVPRAAGVFAVARLDRTAVDLTRWRLTGTGDRMIGGAFSLVDGVVYVKPCLRGFSVIIR